MCIRDRYQRRVHGSQIGGTVHYSGESLSFLDRSTSPNGLPFLILIIFFLIIQCFRLCFSICCFFCSRGVKILDGEFEEKEFNNIREDMVRNHHLTTYNIKKILIIPKSSKKQEKLTKNQQKNKKSYLFNIQ
eukprot:TRINITY_DN19210_c0_g1_i1.p2 TRINITY_DN19210_c0_g1~~TRINITY_DN19210_c0_g1_i1.p2  ORF type:complete len:132 (+),score=18.34 TRINITY_DN19210_c0_g1_i1:158-553(+)